MPAGIEATDKVTVARERGLPWWGGEGHPNLVARDGLVTADEAVKLGGLDFEVELRPILTMGAKGRLTNIGSHKAVVRTDTGAPLGVVGRKYRPIQYREGLADFGRGIIATEEATVDTAGTLFGGKTGFMWFEINGLHLLVKGERPEGEIKTYLGVTTSHDGSSALRALVTPVRTVCANTLNMALRGAKETFTVRHSGSVEGKIEAAREALSITRDYMAEFEAIANRLAAVTVPDADVQGIMEKVWPVKEDLSEGWTERHPATLATKDYFASANLDPIRGTGWGVLNAAVEFIDHEAPYLSRENAAADVKAAAVLWGRGARAKDRALEAVKSYAGIK
jgi:phage/plasmid-like protein (TIGR03299 family)